MKKSVTMMALVLSIIFSGNLFAQDQAQQPKAEVKTIFAYKQELNITDKQEKDLKDILTKFQNDLAEKRKQLQALSAELTDMIRKKDNLKAIRAKIDNISRIQADATYSDVETSRKVENVLTAGQMAKWRLIQEEFQKEVQAKMKEAQEANKAAEAKK